jgi:hypothetical protein
MGVTNDYRSAVYVEEQETNMLKAQNKICFKVQYTDAPTHEECREMIVVGC